MKRGKGTEYFGSAGKKGAERPLWRELPTCQRPAQTNIQDDLPIEEKRKTTTISNFLKDLHVETKSHTESEILQVLDMRYSQSFRSLKTQRKKEANFMLRLLMKALKEIQQEIKIQFQKFRGYHSVIFETLTRTFQELKLKHQHQLKAQNLKIKELTLQLKQANFLLASHQHEQIKIQLQKPQQKNQHHLKQDQNNSLELRETIIKENASLKNYLKEMSQMIKCLTEKNSKLEEKIERSKTSSQVDLMKEIQKVRQKYDHMAVQLREQFHDSVSVEVMKYIRKYELIKQDSTRSQVFQQRHSGISQQSQNSQTSTMNSNYANAAFVSPKSNFSRRFERTGQQSRRHNELKKASTDSMSEQSSNSVSYIKNRPFIPNLKVNPPPLKIQSVTLTPNSSSNRLIKPPVTQNPLIPK